MTEPTEVLLQLVRQFKYLTQKCFASEHAMTWLRVAEKEMRQRRPKRDRDVWSVPLNRGALMSMMAGSLAEKAITDAPLARQLNSFSHQIKPCPLIDGYFAAWNFECFDLPDVLELLDASLKAAPSVRGLIVGPEYGLGTVRLLDHFKERLELVYTNAPGPLSVEQAYFKNNLRRCAHQKCAKRLAAFHPHYEAARGVGYDFVYVEGARNIRPRISGLHTLERLVSGWGSLLPGGIMIIDGVTLRNSSIGAEIWAVGPEQGITAFLRAYRSLILCTEHDGIMKLQKRHA